jgi:hypothetical protein
MVAIMRRLKSGERLWAAEFVVRSLGLLTLALCATAVWWTYRSIHSAPGHPATTLEIAGATTAIVGWGLGWALLSEGPGLFQSIEMPVRHRGLDL